MTGLHYIFQSDSFSTDPHISLAVGDQKIMACCELVLNKNVGKKCRLYSDIHTTDYDSRERMIIYQGDGFILKIFDEIHRNSHKLSKNNDMVTFPTNNIPPVQHSPIYKTRWIVITILLGLFQGIVWEFSFLDIRVTKHVQITEYVKFVNYDGI